MSEFEFLPAASIGQYIPTGSILHRIEPAAKLVGFGALILAVTFSPAAPGLVIGLAAALLGLAAARIPLKFALKGLLVPLPFLLVIAILQVFLYPAGGQEALVTIGPLPVTLGGIWTGILVILRFVGLILLLSLMSYCVSSSELIHGLQKILKPLNAAGIHTSDLVMVIQVALRFLPMMAQTAERVAKAQASRGAEWGVKSSSLLTRVKQVVPLIIPLFTISLKRAETMALAMDARAYGYKPNRTSMFSYSFGWCDAVFLVMMLSISAAILFV